MKIGKLILRIVHGFIYLFFFWCIFEIYFSFFSYTRSMALYVALFAGFIEGVIVFFFNNGDCPLIHIQRKVGDDIPFFELFLPKKYAKKVIPVAAVISVIGTILLIIQSVVM